MDGGRRWGDPLCVAGVLGSAEVAGSEMGVDVVRTMSAALLTAAAPEHADMLGGLAISSARLKARCARWQNVVKHQRLFPVTGSRLFGGFPPRPDGVDASYSGAAIAVARRSAGRRFEAVA